MATEFVYRIGGTGITLTQAEQDNNIKAIYDRMKGYGFSKVAVAGMCGCFLAESSYNPGIYETSHGGNLNNLPYFKGGMGLAQWTDYPAYTGSYPNPLPWSADRENKDWWDGDFQCWLLTKADDNAYTSMGYGQGPRWGWQRGNDPSISFSDYKKFEGDVNLATEYWFFCFEWHYHEVPEGYLELRKKSARHALEVLGGYVPPVGKGKKMPLWMMLKPFL